MSSSDSDSDSEEARLREAVDPEFDAKKKKKKKTGSDDSDQKKDRSLRRDKAKNSFEEGGESVSGSGLSVTKGFQEHVAKKLSESIEK